jgi:hypothetical protein
MGSYIGGGKRKGERVREGCVGRSVEFNSIRTPAPLPSLSQLLEVEDEDEG